MLARATAVRHRAAATAVAATLAALMVPAAVLALRSQERRTDTATPAVPSPVTAPRAGPGPAGNWVTVENGRPGTSGWHLTAEGPRDAIQGWADHAIATAGEHLMAASASSNGTLTGE